MNAFQKHPIQEPRDPFEKMPIPRLPRSAELKENPSNAAKHWFKSHIFLSVLALMLGILALKGVVGAFQMGNPFSVQQIIQSAVGSSVKMDAYKHTNIMLIGVGGEGHDGENLTDTMMVVSLGHDGKTVSMISIPRDFYVENEAVGWGTRLNSVYEYVLDDTENPQVAMQELESQIEEIFGLEIHYYAKIDFKGFEQIVDAVGGVTVEVEQTISDEAYPAPTGSTRLYDPFYLSAGTQELDGETALKYVRSRHNTSDFDRAARQQQVLAALKEKALSLGVLTNPGKIKDTYYAISSNFETNMSITEMLSLVSFAKDLDQDSISSAVINEEANKMGGFLYTPPRDEGQPYYLVPYTDDFSEIQTFAKLFFYHPEVHKDEVSIQVLNGTKEESLAGLTKMYLVRYGFNVTNYGNAASKEVQDTRLVPLFNEVNAEEVGGTLEILPSFTYGEITKEIPEEYAPENWGTSAEIIIELGADFADYYNEHPELFYIGVY